MANWYDTLCHINLQDMTKRKLAKFKNNFVFQNEFTKNALDAMNRYRIEGLPGTVSQRVVIESLFWNGSVYFFEMDGAILALPGAPDGSITLYGDYGGAFVYGRNGWNKHIKLIIPGGESRTVRDSVGMAPQTEIVGVMVRENKLCYPFINYTLYYSDAIADTMRTLDVCKQNIKQPYIIVCEESLVNGVKEFFKRRDNNEDNIITSGVFPADKIKLLPFETNAANLTNATALIDWYENKYKLICGIDANSQIDKKGENLIEAELDINDDYKQISIDKVLSTIQEGLDLANRTYGLNMTVKACINSEGNNDDFFGDGTNRGEDIPGSDE